MWILPAVVFFVPGLVVDKFEDVLVCECETLGMERHKETICNLVKKVLEEDGIKIRGIYERSDASVRKLEGLEKVKGFIGEPFDTNVVITENGVKYRVNIEEGQKTGFFLDQKYNRAAAAKLCKDKKVLDCFTHTGSFALNAGLAGAESVLGVDASDLAVKQATENADQHSRNETCKKRRIPLHMFLFAFHGARAFGENHSGSCKGCEKKAQTG